MQRCQTFHTSRTPFTWREHWEWEEVAPSNSPHLTHPCTLSTQSNGTWLGSIEDLVHGRYSGGQNSLFCDISSIVMCVFCFFMFDSTTAVSCYSLVHVSIFCLLHPNHTRSTRRKDPLTAPCIAPGSQQLPNGVVAN